MVEFYEHALQSCLTIDHNLLLVPKLPIEFKTGGQSAIGSLPAMAGRDRS